MSSLNLITRIHVLSAIKAHDQMGATDFLAEQGVDAPGETFVVERGKRYDASAIVAAAYFKANGAYVSGEDVAAKAPGILRKLDFTVATAADLAAPKAGGAAKRAGTPRTPRASAAPKAPAKPEKVAPVCPRCFMQLPATGVCNYCD